MRAGHNRQAVYGSQQPLPTFHLDDDQVVAQQIFITSIVDTMVGIIVAELQRIFQEQGATISQIAYENLLISQDMLAVSRDIRDSLNSVIAGGAIKVVGI